MGDMKNAAQPISERAQISKALTRDFDVDDHRITAEELCSKFNTDLCFGLTQKTAEAHLARDGKNVVTQPWRGHELVRLLRCMFCGVTLILWLSALLSIVVITLLSVKYNESAISEISVFIALVFDALFIGICFYVQAKNSELLEILPPTMNHQTEVIREGIRKRIPVEELVVGDLILLKFGDQVPADVRIIESQNFKVDNFTLTGMHDPQLLHDKASETNPLESSNIAFFSSKAVEGTARGIVIRTGNRTFLGWVFGDVGAEDKLNCPVTMKIIHCLNKASVLAVIIACIFFLVFWFVSEERRGIDAAMVSAVAILATIPNDLLRAMVLSFLIYARKMSSKTCSMRNILALQKIPFLGTICLNKPGVLTLNKVTVTNLWFDGRTVEVWGGSKMYWKERSSLTFKQLARCAAICNEAGFISDQANVPLSKKQVIGSPNEAAIFKFLTHAIGKKVQKLKQEYPKIYWAPYNESDKFQVSVHEEEASFVVVLIGDPEVLMNKCTDFSMSGRPSPIGESFLREVDKACVQFAKCGDIIKCVIEQTIPKTDELTDIQQFKLPETGFLFLGIITLADIPRPNIAQAVAKCRQAGIKVILTTSDHPITARSFARLIGVITEGSQTLEEKQEERGNTKRDVNAVVIDGNQLNKLSAKGMRMIMDEYSEIVFARTSPIQRLLLIATCQENNSLVAVVGDKTNDVLTMKKADMSISLGEEEKSSSKMKADVYLTDDSFYSLAMCIEEGRTIYENLRKCSAFSLSSNVAGVMAIAAYCFLGVPLPINPTGLVIAELLLKCFPAIALVFEKGDSEIMERPPRSVNGDSLWSRQLIFSACAQIGLIETFSCFFTYFVIMLEFGWTPISLIGIRDSWDSRAITDLEDSYGQKWTYDARKELEKLCQTGYFYSLVIIQCANICLCKNQRVSLIRYKDRNWMIHFSILFDLSLILFITYLPNVGDVTQMRPLKPIWWLLPFPYLLLVLFYAELKKFIVRKSPKGWLARETLF